MGRGIALQFRNAYPENFKAARYCCEILRDESEAIVNTVSCARLKTDAL